MLVWQAGVAEGDVDEDASVVAAHGFGEGVGDAEALGEDAAGIAEEREGERWSAAKAFWRGVCGETATRRAPARRSVG